MTFDATARAKTLKVALKVAGLGALLAVSTVGATGAEPLSVQNAAVQKAAVQKAAVRKVAIARPVLAPIPFPDATMTLTRQPEATTLRLDGILTPAVEQRFRDALRGLPQGQPVVVELSSPGGYTSPGYRMIDAILAERQAGRAIATRVKAGESCESMCVGLYLSGFPRYAAPSAEFMVHAPRSARSGSMTLRSTSRMVTRLQELGAARGWIEKVKAAGGFSGTIDYRERADSLAAAEANIVTDLIR